MNPSIAEPTAAFAFFLTIGYTSLSMRTADFDYALPEELIAQIPAARRESSRLLVVNRDTRRLEHCHFPEFLDKLDPGDLLVLNNSKVIPARLRGINTVTGGAFELLLVEETAPNRWWAMLKPGRRARVGTTISLLTRSGQPTGMTALVLQTNAEGHRHLQFRGCDNILGHLEQLGETPLPPYIRRLGGTLPEDKDRYQTVYARQPGSVAAPTAGLHLTRELLTEAESRGIKLAYVTLHVGLGTFLPVKTEMLEHHHMHEERYEVSGSTAALVEQTKANGKRVVAVGTTTLRVLESAANCRSPAAAYHPANAASQHTMLEGEDSPQAAVQSASARTAGGIRAGVGRTNLFVFPPHHFSVTTALLTNFHLPRSTLLMLVSAFAAPGTIDGVGLIREAYTEAIQRRYRFFSYGDAMLIL